MNHAQKQLGLINTSYVTVFINLKVQLSEIEYRIKGLLTTTEFL